MHSSRSASMSHFVGTATATTSAASSAQPHAVRSDAANAQHGDVSGAPDHLQRCDGLGRPQRRIPRRSVNLHRALHGGEKARRRCSSWTKGFAEPVAVSSTQPTDRPLPRRALGLGLDLVALRARRTQEPKRSRCEGQVASRDSRSIRRRRRFSSLRAAPRRVHSELRTSATPDRSVRASLSCASSSAPDAGLPNTSLHAVASGPRGPTVVRRRCGCRDLA